MSFFNRDSISFLDQQGQRKIADSFITQLDESLEAMEKAISESSIGDIGKISHRLKGASMALQAAQLSDVCNRMETGAKESSRELSNLLIEFRSVVASTRAEMVSFQNDLKILS